MLKPIKDTDYLNGVSTLDLIMIQRHVLGIQKLDSPYKMIAADIDHSDSVNGIDLIELRKLILGVYEELPDNQSWRFVDEAYNFSNPDNPWFTIFPEGHNISRLSTNMDIDFIGVKIGDVNGSVVGSISDASVYGRSQRWPLVFDIENSTVHAGQEMTIGVKARNYENITGWQGTLSFDASAIKLRSIVDAMESDVSATFEMGQAENGLVSFSFADLESRDIKNGELLFTITLLAHSHTETAELFEISSEITPAEAYRGYNDVVPLEMGVGEERLVSKIITSVPNPWIESTRLVVDIRKNQNVRWEFYDNKGRLLFSKEKYCRTGRQHLVVAATDILVEGMIFVRMITGEEVSEYRMIKY